MEDNIRRDIRRLLKTFGVQADDALSDHIARNPDVAAFRVRVTLEDLTDYGNAAPQGTLELQIEEEISGAG